MAIPPTIMAVAISRRANMPLAKRTPRKPGNKRLKIRAKISTNMGRLLRIVETKETSPLCNAQCDNTTPMTAAQSTAMLTQSTGISHPKLKVMP